LKVKEIIEGDFSEIFNGKNKVDAIVCPTMPRLPWKLGEKISIEEGYAADILTIPSNLAGNCAISIPLGKSKEGLPIGLQIICDKFQEEKLFEIAKMILSNNNL
jgi:aspartyl-tRNA(Asn)/glutamyl-tRNA(Gln) amidotransferase subunit A